MNVCYHLLIIITLYVPAIAFGQSPPPAATTARSHVERFGTPEMLAERAATEETARLASNPNDAEALNSRALARMRLSRYDEAYEDLRRAIALVGLIGIAEYQANLGYVLWKLGRVTEAMSAERAALELDEQNFTAHYQLGRFLLLGGDPALSGESAAHLRRALDIDPRRSDVRFDLIAAYRALSETAQAMGQLNVLKDAHPSDPRVIYAEALLASDRGDMNAAIKGLREALRLDPTLIGARKDLGLVYIKLSHWAEAVECFAELARRQTDSVEAAYLHALALHNAGRSADAESEALRALRLDAGATAVHTLLTMIRASHGGANVEASEALTPTAPRPAITTQSIAPDRAGRADEFANQDPRALYQRAVALARNGEDERAARLFARVNELTPHTFDVLYNLGIALYNLDRKDEAGRALAEAADLDSTPAETHFWLALTASAKDDHDNAIEEFKHALEREPDNAEYHYTLGHEYFLAGFWDDAIKGFSRAIDLDPKRAVYVLARADAHVRQGAAMAATDEIKAAAADYEAAAALDPRVENIEYLIGVAYRVVIDLDRARLYLERAIAKQPVHAEALAELGFIAIEQERLDDAEPLLERAVALAPDNGPALFEYARLAIKRRDYAEAARRLEQVIAKDPTHVAAHYQLMLAYQRLKQANKAQAVLATLKRLQAMEEERELMRRLRAREVADRSLR